MPKGQGPSDFLDPPSPRGGWSSEIVTVTNAIVCPPVESSTIQECGVLDAQGAFCGHSATWRGGRAMMTPPKMPTTIAKKMPGTHIFAGQLWAHFGHFMAESMSRLWALDHLDTLLDKRPESIIFIPKRPGLTEAIKGYQREFLDLLGIDIPIQVISEPTEIETLIVPGQGFGLGAISAGTKEFRSYFARNFATKIKPAGEPNLYISRSKLGGREGGAVLEEMLENNLKSNGYDICHPQKLSISEQVAKYRAAENIVGLDGSAFHLFAFVGNPDQKVAVILRRNSNVFQGLKIHVESFSGVKPVIINAVSADWIPEHKSKPGRYSFGQLDFAALAQLLQVSGFINDPDSWEVPRFRRVKRVMENFSKEKGVEYKRVKAGNKIEIVELA